MSYEMGELLTYEWGQDATFGSTTVTHEIVGPRGKYGIVRDISVDITTSVVGTTFVPEIAIGLSSGDVTFGRYCLGTTASTAYTLLGMRCASDEFFTNIGPGRSLSDYAPARTSFTTGPRILLDGLPLSTGGSLTGGSSTTVNPLGRIPAGPFTITNVVTGASGNSRYFTKEPVYPLTVGQTMQVTGINGATSVNIRGAILVLNTTLNYFELLATLGGAYTSGGLANVVSVVSCLQGSGSAAGGGFVRVKVQWIGANV